MMDKGYTSIDNKILRFKLSGNTFLVYFYLIHCMGRKNDCWPSEATISRELGISKTTVGKCIKELVSKRLINCRNTFHTDERTGKTRQSNNHYQSASIDEAWQLGWNGWSLK